MALNLANVELSDSFNVWRLRTNSVISRSMQATGTALSTANTQFNARVTTNGILNVNNNIVFLRSVAVNGPISLTVQPSITFSNTITFSISPTFSAGLTTTTITASGTFTGAAVTGTNFTASGNITGTGNFATTSGNYTTSSGNITTSSGNITTTSGTVSGSAVTATNALTGTNLVLSGSIAGATTISASSLSASGAVAAASLSASGAVTSASLTASGTVTAADFNSTSDATLKTEIVQVQDALEKLNQISGYTFKFIENENYSAGLLAQEVQQILPQAVKTNHTGHLTLNYNAFLAIIVESIKEINKKIDKLL